MPDRLYAAFKEGGILCVNKIFKDTRGGRGMEELFEIE